LSLRILTVGLIVVIATAQVSAQESNWENENRAGLQAYERGEYAQAETLFRHAYQLATTFNQDDHRFVAALINLADALASERKDTEAKTLLEQALTIQQRTVGSENPTAARILNSLGTIYGQEGQYSETESHYLRALEIWENLAEPNYSGMAVQMYNLSNLYALQGKESESKSFLEQVLAIRNHVRVVESSEDALALNSIARAYASQRNYKAALRCYSQSLVGLEKLLGSANPLIAVVLTDMSGVQIDQKKYVDAARSLERSISIREKVFGPDSDQLTVDLSELALIRQLQHRYEEAERLYGRAVSIWEKQKGSSLNFSRSLENLGELYLSESKYDEATAVIKHAVALKEVILRSADPELGRSLAKLATAETVGGHFAEAERIFIRSLTLLESASPRDYRSLITTMNNYAWLLEKTKRKAQADLIQARIMVYRARLQEVENKK
jgi:tetratricopeptide (TPR) repeat protein